MLEKVQPSSLIPCVQQQQQQKTGGMTNIDPGGGHGALKIPAIIPH